MEYAKLIEKMTETKENVNTAILEIIELRLFESGTMEVSFRASVKGFCYEGFKQTGKVTHWMPLPEPPKEE